MGEETPTGVTGAESGAGADLAGASPTPSTDTDSTPSQDVNTGLTETAAQQQDDPLAGVPTLDELSTQQQQGIQHAEALHKLRGAYETLRPQFDELQTKYKPFEPYADRFSDPQQVEQLVQLQEKLWKLEPDPQTGEVVPVTRDFVEDITRSAPETADQLTYDLAFGTTWDNQTGQQIRRLDVLISDLANSSPEWKNHIVKLAGFDPTQSSAPAWEPTAEELQKVEEPLRDTFRKLPYEKRLELSELSPQFINDHLRQLKTFQDAEAQKQVEAQRQQQYQQQQQEVFRQEAIAAGNSYIDSEVKQAFSGFVNSLVERYKPTNDPVINKKMAVIAAAVPLALSHNDTREPLLNLVKELQVLDDSAIQNFDKARDGFAQNAFNYGNKSYVRSKQQQRFQQPNGNGQQSDPVDVGMLKSAATRSLEGLIGQSNGVVAFVYKVLTDALVAGANAHNEEIDRSEVPRQVVTGQPAGLGINQRNGQRITGTTREEVWGI